jgi:hypothetical protein
MNTPKLILAECRNWFEDVQDAHASKYDQNQYLPYGLV